MPKKFEFKEVKKTRVGNGSLNLFGKTIIYHYRYPDKDKSSAYRELSVPYGYFFFAKNIPYSIEEYIKKNLIKGKIKNGDQFVVERMGFPITVTIESIE